MKTVYACVSPGNCLFGLYTTEEYARASFSLSYGELEGEIRCESVENSNAIRVWLWQDEEHRVVGYIRPTFVYEQVEHM